MKVYLPSMNFVSPSMNLSLFLLTRNSYKRDPAGVHRQILERRRQYTSQCKEDNEIETATTKKFKHLVGLYENKSVKCPYPRILKLSRVPISVRPWHLSPNRYDIPKVPYKRYQGAGGAHWTKLRSVGPKTRSKKPKPRWHFYDVGTDMQKRILVDNKYKGIFLTDARQRRATARIMISSTVGCYHNPKDPGATHYNPFNYMMAYNASPKIIEKRPNPHIFLRYLSVPAKRNAIHPRHISFVAGPGRYETRYPRVCCCARKLIYEPDIMLIIDREKRLKFRRLAYTKIKMRLYCTPELRHIAGRGYRRLFMSGRKTGYAARKQKVSKDVKKMVKAVTLYPDSRYIGMINSPYRHPLSIREDPMPYIPLTVRYNCTAKIIIRKQLRTNKKIAFLSGQERFKDMERPLTLTVGQQEKIKETLPVERQLRDHPIMTVKKSQIKSKLTETPPHMMAVYELDLRKRLFKFSPLPGPKVLVTENDTRPPIVQGRYQVKPYYEKLYNVLDFFKDNLVDEEVPSQ